MFVFNRRFSLTFSAALGNSSKLDCAHLHENSRHGYVRVNSTLLIWLNENVSFLGCFFVKLPYDMEHDVPRNRIVYGFHPSLCVKRSAYGTELAEQIMSG